MKVLSIVLGILLGICLIAMGILYLYFRRERKRWQSTAEDNLRAGKEEAADIIRRTMDTVNADAKRMEALPEKEILIEAMTALAAQSRRMDRMEEKMEIVVDYSASINELKKIIDAVNADLNALKTQFKDASALVVSARQAVQGLNTGVELFNKTLGSTEGIQKKLTEMTGNAQKTVQQLETIDTRANTVITETNKLFDAYGNGPMEQIKALGSQLNTIDGTLSALTQSLNGSIGTANGSIQQKLEAISQKVDGVSTALSRTSGT